MRNEKQEEYNFIDKLYMEYINERNPFNQRKIKDEIKSRVPPIELLRYSIRYLSPFEAFRNIFSLDDLFKILKEIEKQGVDISLLTSNPLVIQSIEDIQSLSSFSKEEIPTQIHNFMLKFQGNNIFKYGNFKEIGEKFPYASVNYIDLQALDKMLDSHQNYKGMPIIITIDNVGELPLERLTSIEEYFDVEGVRVIEKARQNNTRYGERRPFDLETYKQIRKVIDDEFLSKLYVTENTNKTAQDYQLATQIVDKVVNRIEYDSKARELNHDSQKKWTSLALDSSIDASGLMGLLTGKSMCKGYSEIVRNVCGCVGVECITIEGIAQSGTGHAWNQIKIGNSWLNLDVTFARDKLLAGEPSGDLFMSDVAFFGERRYVTFDDAQRPKTTLEAGGRKKAISTSINRCDSYISPVVTSNLINNSKLYDEKYKRYGKSIDYKGVIPYIGSNTEKKRLASKVLEETEHP